MLQANFPAKIVYGENSLNFLSTLSAKRVVIFADEVFHKFNPEVFALLDSIFDTMGAQHWLYFGEGTEPTLGFIKENAKKLTEHQPDLILAIGGGSVIDAVKVMEVYYEHPDITNEQLYDRFHLPLYQKIPKSRVITFRIREAYGRQIDCLYLILPGSFERVGFFSIAYDADELGFRHLSAGFRVEKRLQVRSPAGYQHCRSHSKTTSGVWLSEDSMRPMQKAFCPAAQRVSTAFSACSAGTAISMPIPML